MKKRFSLAALFIVAAMAAMPFLSQAQTNHNTNASLEQIHAEIDALKAQRDILDDQAAPTDQAAQIAAAESLPPDEYYKGVVLKLEDQSTHDVGGAKETITEYRVKITSGKEKETEVSVQISDLDQTFKSRTFEPGDLVVMVKSWQPDQPAKWYFADNYRIRPLFWIALLFLLAAVIFGRLRGLTSVLGLGVTVAVIIYYVVPRIAAGHDPLVTCLIAAVAIATLSLYLAHGFNTRTSIALVSTLITLGISAWMAVSWVHWARLFGMGSEDAIFLQGAGLPDIDLRGLLLGGILLGVLGILDDITTAQAAIVEELKRANSKLRFKELYSRGISVGREHIASLINTLFLAYAGASLPLFLLFSVNKGQPLWFIVNSETIAEEIVRTLVGSVCLILAVPITTALAASYFSDRKLADSDTGGLHEITHHHH